MVIITISNKLKYKMSNNTNTPNTTNTSQEKQTNPESIQKKQTSIDSTHTNQKSLTNYQCKHCIENMKLSLSANKEVDKDMQEYFDDPFEDWHYPSEEE